MFRRASKLLVVVALLVSFGGTAWAKKGHRLDGNRELMIIEISPMSVTIDAGRDVQESYTITAGTKASLNGIPVKPGDLRAGMSARFTMASDNQTVLFLAAKPAPRTVRKPPPPSDTVWIWWR
jgi:hypothetical protein